VVERAMSRTRITLPPSRVHGGRVAFALLVLFASCAMQTSLADTYEYDVSGRLTKVVYDDGSSTSYTYDGLGNVISRVDALADGGVPNQPPVVAALLSPSNGATSVARPVTFRWQPGSDPEGGAVTYAVTICTSSSFAGCTSQPVVTAAAMLGGFGAGSLGLLLVGSVWCRRGARVSLRLAAVTALTLSACGGGGGGGGSSGGGGPPPPDTSIRFVDAALAAGTLYYWKVTVTDAQGASSDSPVWSFTTQ